MGGSPGFEEPARGLDVVRYHLAGLEPPCNGLAECPQSGPLPVEAEAIGHAVEPVENVSPAVPNS